MRGDPPTRILSQNVAHLRDCARTKAAKHVAPIPGIKIPILRIFQARMGDKRAALKDLMARTIILKPRLGILTVAFRNKPRIRRKGRCRPFPYMARRANKFIRRRCRALGPIAWLSLALYGVGTSIRYVWSPSKSLARAAKIRPMDLSNPAIARDATPH